MEAYQDGVNASRYGGDYKKIASEVNRTGTLKIKLAEGGGWAARITQTQTQPLMYQEARRSMWTTFEIVAYGPERARLAEAANAAFEEIDRLDRQMSNFSETSELTYINRNAAREEVIVEKELFDFLKLSLDYSRATGGTFDITVGPLMRTWGFSDGKGRVPAAAELAAVMAHVGYSHVHLNDQTHSIKFDCEGVELDLGGIAKGYAVDKAAQILRESGVTSALITSGGSSICAIGAPPGQAAWRVEVSDPADRSHHVTNLDLRDMSISTSGCHEKSLSSGGRTYCHIMDPRAGHPIEGILGATIITPLGVEAEALSKAVMVLGLDGARDLLRGRKDTQAILYYPLSDGSLGSAKLNF
jgi:thiamine biosynthesis lipoprotein